MSRLQTTLLLACLALGATALAAWMASRQPTMQEREQEASDARRVFDFEPEAIRSATVRTATHAFTFARHPELGWELTAPVSWPANPEKIQGLVQRIAWLEADRTVFEDPTAAELAQAGLAPPRVTVTAEVDGQTRRLEFGASNPLVERVYIRADGGPVKVTPPAYTHPFFRSESYHRQTRLFPVPRQRLGLIQLRRDGAPVWTVKRALNDRGGWVTRGAPSQPWRPVDPAHLGVLQALITLRLEADTFVADGLPGLSAAVELPEVGQVRLPVSLTVETLKGLVRTATLALADRSYSDEVVPVALVDGVLAELYAPPLKELMEVSAHGLRDRTLSRFPRREAARLRFDYLKQEPVELVRNGEAWTHPGGRPVVQWLVEDIVVRLGRLRGDDTVTGKPTPELMHRFGLEPPVRRIRVYDGDDALLADVRLGFPSKPGGPLFAQGLGPRVDAVDERTVGKIPIDLNRLFSGP